MTAKEKAIELVHTMFGWTFDDRDDPNTPNLAAYKCALIAVDEIINSNPYKLSLEGKFLTEHITYDINFWEEVKQEIEKL